MAAPHQYHQPNAPDDDADDDSDLELDVQELAPPRRPSKEQRRPYHELGARIPLRNLRVGRLRARQAAHEEDDLHGLLDHDDDDEGTKRDSAASSALSGDDDAPLLASHVPRSRAPPSPTSTLSRLGSHMRLPSFLSPRTATAAIQLGDEGDADDENHDPTTQRTIAVGHLQAGRFPANAVSNAKYTPWSFLPRTLYNEFSFFINMYFLLVALSQVIPALRLGYLSTYVVPLAFVLTITLGKEATDDIARRRRDAEANSEAYTVLQFGHNGSANGNAPGNSAHKTKRRLTKARPGRGRLTDIEDEEQRMPPIPPHELATCTYWEVVKPSKSLKVGDVVKLGKDQRVPADMVLLKTYAAENTTSSTPECTNQNTAPLIDDESTVLIDDATQQATAESALATTSSSGEAFIRTDQLDGETDWKLRLTSPLTQNLHVGEYTRLRVVAGKPDRKVNEFYGTVELPAKAQRHYDPHDRERPSSAGKTQTAPLSIDNTIWANTVVASSGTLLAVVVYTGPQTRQALSTSPSRSKTGLLELEINSLTKWLCIFTLSLSFVLVAVARFQVIDGRPWYVSMMRFLILFSTIVPVGLRVNLDMGKSVYAWFIEHDQSIAGTVVRTSTIPEDLGRIEYLLSDKTGTLTQNGMYTANRWACGILTSFCRDGHEEDTRRDGILCQRGYGRGFILRAPMLYASCGRGSLHGHTFLGIHCSTYFSDPYPTRDRVSRSRRSACFSAMP